MTAKALDAETLRVLSRLFTYPQKWPEKDDLRQMAMVNESIWEGPSDKKTLQDLQNHYVSLFINTLPEIPCPPYGSFYLEGALMGPSTIQLRNIYHSYGFQTDEVPDHIAVELEFLAFLSTRLPHDPVQADYEFLFNHLRQWTPEFFNQIEQNDTMGFYKDVSRWARQVIF